MYDLSDVNFEKTLKRLENFARSKGFDRPWQNIYFIENRFIEEFYGISKESQIPREHLISGKDYETRFEELLRQGHTWINVHFLGILEDMIIISMELPTYKNDALFTSPNLSLPASVILNWEASSHYEIV